MEPNEAYTFEEHMDRFRETSKKQLLKKTKKELVDMVILKKQLTESDIEIYCGQKKLLSYPVDKKWKAFTLSCYIKNDMIEEVCIWEKHMIDEAKKDIKFLEKIKQAFARWGLR